MTRIGASQVFFNIVANWNANKLISDAKSMRTVMKAVSLDTFEAILKPIEDFGMQIEVAIAAVRDLAQEMGFATIEFEKFFGDTNDIEYMRDKLLELGEAYAISGEDALSAGSRASQVANLIGRGNVGLLVEQANILSEISDLDAESAMRGIIQLQQQTGFMYGEMNRQTFQSLSLRSQEIVLLENTASGLNKLNTIANRSVAMEGDIVHVMSQFAAQGHLVGDSFEAMAAMSAVLLEAGEEQGTAGRALRAMYARLGGNINGATDAMEDMGIVMRDEDGLISMEEILANMNEKWGDLTSQQKQNIAQTVSGNRHYVRFIKLMENYDRFIGLTSDGFMEFDSASKQAEKAQEALAFQLKSVTIEGDNLRAMIGEGLTPFMIGQTEATNDYMRATEMLTDGLGKVGTYLGRLSGTMKVTGGFIKFGLAIQSVGIGFEMYESVLRSLNGIMVANEALHSKEANYLEYGVIATKAQEVLLKGIQHTHQKINAAMEQRRIAEKEMSYFSEGILENKEAILKSEESNALLLKSAETVQERRLVWVKFENGLLEKGNGLYETRRARMQTIGELNDDLAEKSMRIYNAKSADENAMKRQILADMQVYGAMSTKEMLFLDKRNESLKRTHTLLQQIKAENEKARALGKMRFLHGDEKEGTVSRTSLGAFSKTIGDRDLLALEDHFAKAINMNAAYIKTKQLMMEDETEGSDRYLELEREIKALGELNSGYRELKSGLQKGSDMELTKQGFDALMASMSEVQGKTIQTTRGMETLNLAMEDAAMIVKRLNELKKSAATIESSYNKGLKVTLDLETQEAETMMLLAPLIDRVNDSKLEEIERTKALQQAIQLLSETEKDIMASKQYKTFMTEKNDEFLNSQDRANKAARRGSFAIMNLGGVIAGMGGSTRSAALSMAMLSTNFLQAGGAAVAAAKSVMETQRAMFAAKMATDGLVSAQVMLRNTMLKTAVVLGVVYGAFYLLEKSSKAAADETANLQEELFAVEDNLQRMQASTEILGGQDGLAEMLGMENYTLNELANNADLAADAYSKLTDHTLDLSNAHLEAVAGGLLLLDMLKAMQSGSNILEIGQFAEWERRLGDKMDMGFWEGMGSDTRIENKGGRSWLIDKVLGSENEQKKAMKLAEELGMEWEEIANPNTSGYSGFGAWNEEGRMIQSDIQPYIDRMIENMRAGIQLTEEQLDLFAEIVDDNSIVGLIRSMNQVVIPADSMTAALKGIEDGASGVGDEAMKTVSDLKNLTDEIYSFSGAREELFFGGKYGNVTGSLYRQVVKQGVGTLYHKNEIIMNTNFHGFFNEQEASDKIIAILTKHLAGTGTA